MNKFFHNTVCFFMLALLTACGGGTVGTGGGREYSGTVLDKSSQPVANATVSLTESGESTLTDANGAFSINAKEPAVNETFTIKVEDVETSTTIENIPEANTVEVLFIVNTDDNSVEGTIVESDSEKDPEDTNSGSDQPDETDDSDDTDTDESSNPQNLIANVTLDRNAPIIVSPVSATSFQELSSLSSFSMFFAILSNSTDHSVTATMYFFRVSETTWEYRVYIDESEIANGVSRRPFQLANGFIEFDQSGMLLGGAKSQNIEVLLAGEAVPTICNLTVNAKVTLPSSDEDGSESNATTLLELTGAFAVSDTLTAVPASRTFSSLSSAASFETTAQLLDFAGISHTLSFYFFRTAPDLWELFVLANGSEIQNAAAGRAVELLNFSINLTQNQTTPPSISRSQNVIINWVDRPETQIVNVTINATIADSLSAFSINAQ